MLWVGPKVAYYGGSTMFAWSFCGVGNHHHLSNNEWPLPQVECIFLWARFKLSFLNEFARIQPLTHNTSSHWHETFSINNVNGT